MVSFLMEKAFPLLHLTLNTVGVLGRFYHSCSRLRPAQFVFMIQSQANPPPPPLKLSTCSPTEALREFGILQLGL